MRPVKFNNKMLMHAFILVTVMATAKSAEAEITMEAAFQGHCGHTSPCEQLCYEIHDGMYECDCIEGYELNKNGYSCQVINSTSTSEGHSKSDEDVLYQKGTSFSAKLAGNGNMDATGNGGLSMTSYEAIAARVAEDGDDDDDGRDGDGMSSASRGSSASTEENDYGNEDVDDLVDSFFNREQQKRPRTKQQKQQLQKQKQQKSKPKQQDKVNSQDYYISAESINYSNEQEPDPYHDLLSNNNNNNNNNKNNNNNSPVVPDYKANKHYRADVNAEDDSADDSDDSNDLVNSQRRTTAISTAKPRATKLQQSKNNKSKKSNKSNNNNKHGDIKFKLSLRDGNVHGQSAATAATAKVTQRTTTATTSIRPSVVMKLTSANNGNGNGNGNGNNDEDDDTDESNANDDYYAKQELDMSVYDDVNNNQLNLRPLGHQYRYKYEYQQQQQKSQPPNTYQQHEHDQHDTQSMSITGAAAIAAGRLTAAAPAPTQTPTRSNMNSVGADAETAALSVTNNEILGISITMTGASVADGASKVVATTAAKNTNISEHGGVECNLDCGALGVCERLLESGAAPGNARMRCLCPFGKVNNGCIEDVKVRVPKFSKRSWLAFPALHGAYKHVQLRIEFRPEAFNGILLLSGERDDLTGDFMALLLNKGFVEFWFDCGSGVGSVRSRETIMLNEWNSIIIYRHRWDAWLVLNHGTKVQGRSNGLFSRITFREPVFLGGTGNITGLAKRLPISNGFVGCIRRFVANEHDYKFDEYPVGDVANGFDIQDCITDKCFKYPCQHGGKCLPSDQGAVCLCPIGYVGDLCEIRMDLQVPAFNGSSFLRYAPLGDSMLIWMELKVIFKPEHPDGLMMYSGPEKHGDFIALSLNEGFVEFTFDLGSGPAVVRSEYPVTIGQWHTVQVSRTARLAVLKIDQSPEVMTISTNGFWHLSLPDNLFVGGVNHADRLPLDLKYKPFFVGCIQKIDINGHELAIISEALGGTNIGNCPHACVARPCGPLAECVPQMESYECRCSAYNAQCNKEAEMSMEDLQRNKSAKGRAGKPLGTVNRELKGKKSGLNYKPAKTHYAKSHAHVVQPKQLLSSNQKQAINSIPARATATTTSHPSGLLEDDDIIFRDVHGMHRKYGHQKPPTSAPITMSPKQIKPSKPHLSKHLTTGHRDDGGGLKKYDAHHKYTPFEPRKLSRMPTHYESFQTDSESDILTFDDNVEVELRLPPIGEDSGPVLQSTEEEGEGSDEGWSFVDTPMGEEQDVKQAHSTTTTKPFILDDSLFDGSDEDTEEYQRKQLAQDMRRILTNPRMNEATLRAKTSSTTTTTTTTTSRPSTTTTAAPPQIVTDDYRADDATSLYESDEWEDDYSEEDAKLIATARRHGSNEFKYKDDNVAAVVADDDYDDDGADDELLSAVRQHQTIAPTQQSVRLTTPPQTHTDWSLLKKLDLSAEQAQQMQAIGVRKNFGACFAGKDSYFHYNDAETMSQIISYNIDLNLRIKTHSPDGVILWTGRQGDADEFEESNEDDNNNNNNNSNGGNGNDSDDGIRNGDIGDFLSLGIENGYLHFRYDLGSGEVDIRYNVSRVSDGLWHRVRAIRNSQDGYLEVDGRKSLTQHAPGNLRQLNTDTGLYVGGMPELSYFTRRKYNSGIVGCISEIILAGELKLNFDPNTLGTSHNVETGIL